MTDNHQNPNTIAPIGSRRLIQVNGRFYEVQVLPAHPISPIQQQPQSPALAQPHPYSAPVQKEETWLDVMEKRGLLDHVKLLLWIAISGMSIALVIEVIRAITPQPVAPQANQFDPAIATVLQQQKQVVDDLRSQNAQLFQKLQEKPTYERQCTPGFLGLPVCSEIRRSN